MNVNEIVPGTNGTLSHYAETALPFTFATIWIIIASQNRYIFPDHLNFRMRLVWPIVLLWTLFVDGLNKWKRKWKFGNKETMGDYFSSAAAVTIANGGAKED